MGGSAAPPPIFPNTKGNAMSDTTNWKEEYKDFNKELEAKIIEANQDESLVKWSKLLPELMCADVFMAGQRGEEKPADASDKLMNILMIQKNGHMVVPCFTSPDRMKALLGDKNETVDVMKINTVRFFKSIMNEPVVLNPMTPYTRFFTPFEMAILAAENEDKIPPLPEEK